MDDFTRDPSQSRDHSQSRARSFRGFPRSHPLHAPYVPFLQERFRAVHWRARKPTTICSCRSYVVSLSRQVVRIMDPHEWISPGKPVVAFVDTILILAHQLIIIICSSLEVDSTVGSRNCTSITTTLL